VEKQQTGWSANWSRCEPFILGTLGFCVSGLILFLLVWGLPVLARTLLSPVCGCELGGCQWPAPAAGGWEQMLDWLNKWNDAPLLLEWAQWLNLLLVGGLLVIQWILFTQVSGFLEWVSGFDGFSGKLITPPLHQRLFGYGEDEAKEQFEMRLKKPGRQAYRRLLWWDFLFLGMYGTALFFSLVVLHGWCVCAILLFPVLTVAFDLCENCILLRKLYRFEQSSEVRGWGIWFAGRFTTLKILCYTVSILGILSAFWWA
jgi:hypothetical protein